MIPAPSSARSCRTVHPARSGRRPAAAVEGLESRVLFAFAADTSIPAVVDEAGNAYVLGTEGLGMAVARYTPGGQLDTAWSPGGTFTVGGFGSGATQDVPKALAYDPLHHWLYVAGSAQKANNSYSSWAIAKLRVDTITTAPQFWTSTPLSGTANALWLDSSDGYDRIGVAGTDLSGNIQVAVLHASSSRGGTFDTDAFGGTGYATAPASVYRIPGGFSLTASPSALVEKDDLPCVRPGEGENEWLVTGTVTFSPGRSGMKRSRGVVVDFLPDGTSSARVYNGRAPAPFNFCGDCTADSLDESNSYGRGRGRGHERSDLGSFWLRDIALRTLYRP